MAEVIAPGATIGILGGGQLGRMLAIAAAEMGYRSHIYAPEADPPAGEVATAVTTEPYENRTALDAFARAVDVVTLEFENVPVEAAEHLAEQVPVRPGPDVLRICQDRLTEKEFLNGIGVATTRFHPAHSAEELAHAAAGLGGTVIAKTARLGYDGKGQVALEDPAAARDAWARMNTARAIAEERVAFRMELSVICARSVAGEIACFVPVENRHKNHILDETVVPAPISPDQAQQAEAIARRIAEALDLVGLIAAEMFLTDDGRLLVNELAPRPHNSGHWTLDAAATSQFSQAVRAVCGLPLGDPSPLCHAVMKNLIGEEAEAWAEHLKTPGACLHLYGKAETRPGRKMGHVTFLQR